MCLCVCYNPTHHTSYLVHSRLSVCLSVTQQLDRVDFVMGFVVQLVMEFVEIGNRGDVHGKGSSAGKLLGN